tara:strand:+ start:2401 stop:2718 length:318 start_codon:yes stop_codon:yes gene_type:complete
MTRRPDKAQIRDEIDRKVREFVINGGTISQVKQGATGLGIKGLLNPNGFVERPRDSRTPVSDVVASIEVRRNPKANSTVQRPKRPRKKMLFDDFGEPLRWVWVEE